MASRRGTLTSSFIASFTLIVLSSQSASGWPASIGRIACVVLGCTGSLSRILRNYSYSFNLSMASLQRHLELYLRLSCIE